MFKNDIPTEWQKFNLCSLDKNEEVDFLHTTECAYKFIPVTWRKNISRQLILSLKNIYLDLLEALNDPGLKAPEEWCHQDDDIGHSWLHSLS